ncbi:MAG: AI-2E family transporter [Patescibacteria group bacterium]|nr:AI-2E family transporter [Patescibacteria group bacterium]
MRKREWHFFLSFLLAITLLVLLILLPFLNTLALAVVFAVVLAPLQRRLARQFGGRQTLAALVLVALVLVIIVVASSFFLTQLVNEARDVYVYLSGNSSAYWDHLDDSLSDLFGRVINVGELDWRAQFNQLAAWAVNSLGSIFSGAASFLFKALLWLIALFYLLRDGPRFHKALIKLSPLPDHHDENIGQKLAITIKAVVRGVLLVALLQGFLVGVGFALFGVPKATLWGTTAVLSALIPGVGTSLVLIPGIIFLLVTTHWAYALGLLIWGALIVGLVDNLLAPSLYSRGGKVHPLMMLFAALGGLIFFGPIGLILGPVTLSLLAALVEIYQESASA